MKLWKEAITLHIVVPGKTIAPWFMGKKLQLLSSTFKRNEQPLSNSTNRHHLNLPIYINQNQIFLEIFLDRFQEWYLLRLTFCKSCYVLYSAHMQICHCIMQLEHRNKTNQLTLEKFFFLNELQQESWQYK